MEAEQLRARVAELERELAQWTLRCAEARSVAREWEVKCGELERENAALGSAIVRSAYMLACGRGVSHDQNWQARALGRRD